MLTTSLHSFQNKIQFALYPFRSLLIRASLLFSFPAGTKMFQFPAYVCLSTRSCEHVTTLGDSGFNSCMQITQTYRSLPRPSSRPKPSYPSNSIKNQILHAFVGNPTRLIEYNSKLPPKRISRGSYTCVYLKSSPAFSRE